MPLHPKKVFEFMGLVQGFYKRCSPNNIPPIFISLQPIFMEITKSLKYT
jgi:hypothetical protein